MVEWKITVDGVDYINDVFTDILVIGRENGVFSVALSAANSNSLFYPARGNKFSTCQVSAVKLSDPGGSFHEMFDGVLREPVSSCSNQGKIVAYKGKGLGAAFENTHCNTNFGYTSQNDGLNTLEEIWEDLVDNYVNKSYGSANNTGYSIGKDYVQAIDAGYSIPFINAPYQTNKQVIDLTCMLDTAYRNGATAGPHWFVDVSGNLRIKTIGTQQAHGGFGGGDWGIYCGGSNNAVSLYEGEDFINYSLSSPTDQYANSVVLVSDFRKPAYDYWTEDSGGAALWTDSTLDVTDSAAEFIVGSHSLRMETQDGPPVDGYTYIAPETAEPWNIEAWGSEKNPPRVNFYIHKNGDLGEALSDIRFFTTDVNNDYFQCLFSTWTENDDEWIHKSIPIGPYWASTDESKQYRWADSNPGTTDWADINGFAFVITGGGVATHAILYVDDLHFSGKIIREAVDTTEVTAYDEYQYKVISNTPLDDTCVAATDTGMAASIAYAELLRRVSPPRTLICNIALRPELKPGEHFKVYCEKTLGGAYNVNGVDFRVLRYEHHISQPPQGAFTTLYLTDDVLNSYPLTHVDAQGVLNEYMLENNSKATDMKGGGIDLLIPHLRKTY